jgi:hypothetical protein
MKPCYALDCSLVDDSASVTAKMFTKAAEFLLEHVLQAVPAEEIDDKEGFMHRLLSRPCSVRLIISHFCPLRNTSLKKGHVTCIHVHPLYFYFCMSVIHHVVSEIKNCPKGRDYSSCPRQLFVMLGFCFRWSVEAPCDAYLVYSCY